MRIKSRKKTTNPSPNIPPRPRARPHEGEDDDLEELGRSLTEEDEEDEGALEEVTLGENNTAFKTFSPKMRKEVALNYPEMIEELRGAVTERDEYIEQLQAYIQEQTQYQEMLGEIAQLYKDHRGSLIGFSEALKGMRDAKVQELESTIESMKVQIETFNKEVSFYKAAIDRLTNTQG